MTDSVVVTIDEAVPLLHALVGRIASRHGVRVLFLKGPALAVHGLREPRASSDVDVLCDPSHFDDLGAVLESHGWTPFYAEDTGPTVLEKYATSFLHDFWPCAVDVHRSFPGFFAPEQRVFDTLSGRRVDVGIATKPVPTCDVLGSALVQALHLERNRSTNWYDADRAHLVTALRTRLTEGELHDLSELAATTGSADVLSTFLKDVGAPVAGHGSTSPADLESWRLRAAVDDTPVILWVEELRRARPHQWPGIIWRGLTYDDRPRVDDHHQISTRPERVTPSLLLRRAWKMLRYSPGAVRELVRLRRRS